MAHQSPAAEWQLRRFGNVHLSINNLGQLAGNGFVNGAASHAFRLDPTAAGFVSLMLDAIQFFQLANGAGNELSAFLRACMDALARGNNTAARNQLVAFENAVSAGRGNRLTTAQAEILLDFAGKAIQLL